MQATSGSTLEELLREQEAESLELAASGGRLGGRKRSRSGAAAGLKAKLRQPGEEGEASKDSGREKKKLKKQHKNAPAEMKSNRPVSRHRDVVNVGPAEKSRDPRFSEVSGKLNPDIFLKSYEFLDQYQEDEVVKMQKSMKKIKNAETAETIKSELQRKKQEMAERRRDMKLRERMSALKAAEKEKVKAGKNPFFLKKSAIKDIALEQRFDELKSSGKLNSFLAKKRQKNANKDHVLLPRNRRV